MAVQLRAGRGAVEEAAAKEFLCSDVLEQILSEDASAKTRKNVAMRTAIARFPFVKPLETFDFGYQPTIDKKQVQALAGCHFIEHGDNVPVPGPPGLGKAHLAVALCLKAIETGDRLLFATVATVIATLTKAHAEGRLDEKLKFHTTPRLLIIDQIGPLPIARLGANVLFRLISRRCGRGPMVLASHPGFVTWGDVFGDRIIATAILDRVLHHVVTLNIRGQSYRLNEELKAGLVRAEDTEAQIRVGCLRLLSLGKSGFRFTAAETSASMIIGSKATMQRAPSSAHGDATTMNVGRTAHSALPYPGRVRGASTGGPLRAGDETS